MSSKRPTDHLEPASKRRSDRQITKDDVSDDEGGEVRLGLAADRWGLPAGPLVPGGSSWRPAMRADRAAASRGCRRRRHRFVRFERRHRSPPRPLPCPQAVDPGNFARASEDVIKQRKIVRARRGGDAGAGGAAKANPFAGIQLAAAPAPAAANPFAGVSLLGGGAAPAATPAPTPAKAEPEAAEQPHAAQPPAAPEAKQEAPAGEAAHPPADAAAAQQPEAAQQEEAAAGQKQEAEQKPVAEAAKPAGGFGALSGGASGGLTFGSSGFGSTSGGFGSLGACAAVGTHACPWVAMAKPAAFVGAAAALLLGFCAWRQWGLRVGACMPPPTTPCTAQPSSLAPPHACSQRQRRRILVWRRARRVHRRQHL